MRKSNRKSITLVLCCLVLTGIVLGPIGSASADNLFAGLWPFGEKEQQAPVYDPYNTPYRSTTRTPATPEPSFIEKANQDVKGFFAKTGEILHLRSPEPVQMRSNNPYVKAVDDPRHLRSTVQEKPNWFESIFFPEPEPPARPVQTMQEFVGLPRPQ